MKQYRPARQCLFCFNCVSDYRVTIRIYDTTEPRNLDKDFLVHLCFICFERELSQYYNSYRAIKETSCIFCDNKFKEDEKVGGYMDEIIDGKVTQKETEICIRCAPLIHQFKQYEKNT